MSDEWINNIKLGQEILIKNKRYRCRGYANFSYEQNKIYQEIELYSLDDNKTYWLEIEKETDINYYIYRSISNHKYESYLLDEFIDTNYLKGLASVLNCHGNIDLDIGEKLEFIEYTLDNEYKILSKEIWECGEIEYSIGTKIDESDIEPTDNVDDSKINHIKFEIIFVAILILICVALLYKNNSENDKYNCGQSSCTKEYGDNCCGEDSVCCKEIMCETINRSRGHYSSSIRNSSTSSRNPVGGGTSFGK